jgi:hypothetical protein
MFAKEGMEVDAILKSKIDLIARAIEKRSAIVFRTSGNDKYVVEPFVLGKEKNTGHYILKCYKSFPLELSDKKENWLTFDIETLLELHATPIRSKSSSKGFEGIAPVELSEVISSVPGFEG